jgi:ankyrin repeat protein
MAFWNSDRRRAAALVTFVLLGAPLRADTDGMTALHRAVAADNVDQARKLLRGGARAESATPYGITPLAIAVTNGNSTMTELLLEAGANANTASGDGETLLMTAAGAGHLPIVKLLLARGADPNARDGWRGQTALTRAAGGNHAAVVTALLTAGADPNATDDQIDFFAMVPSEQATPKIPLPKGGVTVLHYAARQGALDAVRALTASRALDIDRADPDGVTPLLYAALNGHYDVAAFLLEHGASPTKADQSGRTVLYTAIELSRPDREPRPWPRTSDQTTPLALARLALDKGAVIDARITGRMPNRCLLGCQPSGGEGATSLWRAARASDAEAVQLLLAAGADPAATAADGTRPLMLAAGVGWRDDRAQTTQLESIEVIRQLLAAGAGINDASAAGDTALHGAAGRDAEDVIRFLVAKGADLHATDKSGRTPLDVALGRGGKVKVGGGAAMDPVVRETAARVLRELMDRSGL